MKRILSHWSAPVVVLVMFAVAFWFYITPIYDEAMFEPKPVDAVFAKEQLLPIFGRGLQSLEVVAVDRDVDKRWVRVKFTAEGRQAMQERAKPYGKSLPNAWMIDQEKRIWACWKKGEGRALIFFAGQDRQSTTEEFERIAAMPVPQVKDYRE